LFLVVCCGLSGLDALEEGGDGGLELVGLTGELFGCGQHLLGCRTRFLRPARDLDDVGREVLGAESRPLEMQS